MWHYISWKLCRKKNIISSLFTVHCSHKKWPHIYREKNYIHRIPRTSRFQSFSGQCDILRNPEPESTYVFTERPRLPAMENCYIFLQLQFISVYSIPTTEYTQNVKGRFLTYVPSRWKNEPRSRIHERTISLMCLGIILRVLRLEVSVWISWTIGKGIWFSIRFSSLLLYSVQ